MNPLRSAAWQRPFLWMGAIALVVLAAISITRVLGLRNELTSQVTAQITVTVADAVDTWETALLERLDQALEELAVEPTEASRAAAQIRRRGAWLDSLYLWVPAPSLPVGTAMAPKVVRGTLVHPNYPATEDTRRIHLHPCLGAAKAVSIVEGYDAVTLAELYVDGCAGQPMTVRLVAATEAATVLHRAGRDDLALLALDSARLPPDLPVGEAIAKGLAPFRVVGHRTQRAQILLSMGRMDEGLDLLYATGREVADLDATHANGLLPYLRWPIMAELEEHGREQQAVDLADRLERAERRARAWREVEERLLPRSASDLSEPGRFVQDQYGDPPFVLYYRLVRGGEYAAAAVLDQSALIADFAASLPALGPDLVVTDADGSVVYGATAGGPIAVAVPFTRTLTQLRVGVREQAISTRVRSYGNQWLTPLLVTVVFVLVGIAGISAQMRATNRQNELLVRQREFTTRVTHELKTPLAGIKVMAENLQMGAFRDPTHREDMARRIVDEADRLTARVDEILSVGRERTVPNPRKFDPEEPLLEAIDDWGPRLEDAGVKLIADLNPTDSVLGDAAALRDAVACLLDNGLKYHDERKAEPTVWLTLGQDGKHIVVDVADNGIGVPTAMRKAIFERFVRVEGPNRGAAGGHGLGLAQVAEIARMHKGTVECTPGVDGGARFTLRLPAHQ